MELPKQLETLRSSSKLPPGLISPNYEGLGIVNLPDSFAKILDVPNSSRFLRIDPLYSLAEGCENVIFLLLDGFGYHLVNKAREKQLQLKALETLLKESLFCPITSVFPSTTSTATTTLHTGLTPQEHGILGYTMYMQELGAICQMLRFAPLLGGRNSIFDLGIGPREFIGAPTIHEKLKEEGVDSSLYINKWIVDSGLSEITNRGARIFPHVTSADMFVRLRKNLENASTPAFHFAYLASPDTVAHARGPFSEEFASEVDALFYTLETELMAKLDREKARETILLISADHGMSQIEENQIINISEHKELQRMLKVPPTGDSRALFLHVKEGEEQKVATYFDQRFPNDFFVRDSASLLDQGFFGSGKVKAEVKDRIGSLTAVPKTRVAVDNSDLDSRSDVMPGRHGGLSEEEMLVPLIARKLA